MRARESGEQALTSPLLSRKSPGRAIMRSPAGTAPGQLLQASDEDLSSDFDSEGDDLLVPKVSAEPLRGVTYSQLDHPRLSLYPMGGGDSTWFPSYDIEWLRAHLTSSPRDGAGRVSLWPVAEPLLAGNTQRYALLRAAASMKGFRFAWEGPEGAAVKDEHTRVARTAAAVCVGLQGGSAAGVTPGDVEMGVVEAALPADVGDGLYIPSSVSTTEHNDERASLRVAMAWERRHTRTRLAVEEGFGRLEEGGGQVGYPTALPPLPPLPPHVGDVQFRAATRLLLPHSNEEKEEIPVREGHPVGGRAADATSRANAVAMVRKLRAAGASRSATAAAAAAAVAGPRAGECF